MISQSILFFLDSVNQDIFIFEKNLKKKIFISKTYPEVKIIKNFGQIKKNSYDYVYETTGSAKVIEKAYNSIKLSGKLILIGVPNSKSKIKINTLEINYGKKIIGSYGGGVKPARDIKKIVLLLKKKGSVLKNLYEKIYNFKDINFVIKQLIAGKIIKKPILKL